MQFIAFCIRDANLKVSMISISKQGTMKVFQVDAKNVMQSAFHYVLTSITLANDTRSFAVSLLGAEECLHSMTLAMFFY